MESRAEVLQVPLQFLFVLLHVTPSTPGAAPRRSWRNAFHSRSTVTWWNKAVNFVSLFLLAAWRTRSSSLGASCFRHCVRDAFRWCAFPLAGHLPSTTSAATDVALFDGFVGTTCPSDFRCSYIIGVRLPAFPTRPASRHPRASSGSPGSRPGRFSACMGSATAPGCAPPRGIGVAHVAFRNG